MKLKVLCIFCIILCAWTLEVAAKGATCEFTVFYANNVYTCSIKSFDLSGNNAQMVIKGAHDADKSNDDVENVFCNKCTAPVPIFDIKFCQKFKNLERIYLENLEIKQVDPKTFENCQKLKYLKLDGNKIVEITENLLSVLPKLIGLSFSNNKISLVAVNAFKNQKELQVLHLSYNQLSSLPPKVFEPLINLNDLVLNHNQLTTIHSDSFGIHRQLTFISFWGNKINAIDEKFINNTAVNELYMNENICYGDWIKSSKREIKKKLQKCFDNYQPRPLSVSSNTVTASCGRSKSTQGNIIGGSFAAKGDFPWNAAMFKDRKFICGGTLVSEKKVVSAAHCIHQKQHETRLYPRDVKVLLGMHDLHDQFQIGRKFSAVWDIHIHPRWNPEIESYDADISVLVLEETIQFNNHIQPICLIEPGSVVESITSGFVIGYGRSEDTSKMHENVPKILDVPIHDNFECVLKFNDLVRISSRNTFCGGQANGTGVCDGDSGSGMIVKHEGTYYLRGIVSSSLRNSDRQCDVNSYAVYTNVLKYREWIDSIDVKGNYLTKK